MTDAKQMTLAEVKAGQQQKPAADPVPGFFSAHGMGLLEQAANMLTYSDMVPTMYRSQVKKGNSMVENKAGFSNCIVAVNLAHSMGMDVLTVMQNMHVIEGKPSWSAAFIIARINACGLFSRLHFDISDPGEEVTAEFMEYEGWGDNRRGTKKTATMRKQSCRAWAKDLQTGEVLKGTLVTVDMAIAEGWARKAGSKWHTMQEQMLMYRSAAMWCRVHAPELLHGLPTEDEIRDTIEAEIVDGVMRAKPLDKADIEQPARRKRKPEDAEDAQVVEAQAKADDEGQTRATQEKQPEQQEQPDQPRQRRTRAATFNVD